MVLKILKLSPIFSSITKIKSKTSTYLKNIRKKLIFLKNKNSRSKLGTSEVSILFNLKITKNEKSLPTIKQFKNHFEEIIDLFTKKNSFKNNKKLEKKNCILK
jgi:hypothetical protein